MLLNITNRCHGECKHCWVNATPHGEHMSMETFRQAKKFIKKMKPLLVIVSGGEPFEHPHLFQIIKELLELLPREQIMIVSNGQFLYNEELTKKALDLKIPIQVTYDPRYYPHPINMDIKSPYIRYGNLAHQIYPLGRAVTNKLPIEKQKGSKCFNLRSFARNNTSSLFQAIKMLEMMGKQCTPSIDQTGNIHPGESSLCASIGTVYTSEEELFNNLVNMKCNKCGMITNLPDMYKKAIGED